MSEVFSILLHNRQRYEQGKEGLWFSLPTTTEKLQAALREIGISTDNPQDFFLYGYRSPQEHPLMLPRDMVLSADVDELNFLAARLEKLDAAELAELNAALTSPQSDFHSIGQIIDYPENVDYYVHLPDVTGTGQLGDYYLNRSGMVDMPQEWKAGIFLPRFGLHIANTEHGVFTDYGYLVKSGDEWQRVHEGQPVPEEYRVMAFPPPEILRDEVKTRQAAVSSTPAPQSVVPLILNGQNNAERMKEITDRLETGIQELFESEHYKAYLTSMAKFHSYSFNNTLLIAMQGGELVAGYNKWRDEFHRNVKKGEKGIKILAPAPYKTRKEVPKLDEYGKPVMGRDGKPLTEIKEIQVPAFKIVTVFDVSQTEGEPLPAIGVEELTGDVEKYQDFFKALEQTSPVPMTFEDIPGSSHGYYHLTEKRIAIQDGMSELQTLKTAIHEIAHAKLHAIDKDAPATDQPDSRTREVQAESVAYAVCQHYGLDTSDYSFGYVAGWSSGKDLKELKASLETIRATAHELITTIDGHLAELQQQRQTQQTAEQPEPVKQAAEQPNPDSVFAKLPPEQQKELTEEVRATLQTLVDADLKSTGEVSQDTKEAIQTQGFTLSKDGNLAPAQKPEQTEAPAPDPAAEPVVTILWSESPHLQDGQQMPLHEADAVFKKLDSAKRHEREQPDYTGSWYDKTKFRIDFTMQGQPDNYEGRQDFGDGDGSLIEHIQSYHEYYAQDESWKNYLLKNEGPEAWAADKAQREMLLDEFIPYMKLHCNLAAMEQETRRPLQSRETLTPEQTAYFNAVLDYVNECRPLLNQGQYQLPEPPKLSDFDQSLQDYKKQVQAEIVQEAADAGMTVEEYAAAGYEAPAQQAQPTTEPQISAAADLTNLQKKALEIFDRYKDLPLQNKIDIIAQAFGCTTGKIETSPCTGKWRGTSDISIRFDNGASLFIGNQPTPKAKTVKIKTECVNSALVQFNPEIVSATKEAALPALLRREAKDNAIAAQRGLKPYTLLNVEFNDGANDKSGGYMGWYYVTLAVDGKICTHMETGLNHDIADGKVSETPTRKQYFAAGALKETDVDYVFNNVGFSSASSLYAAPLREDVRERAERTLVERGAAQPVTEAPSQTEQPSFSIYQLRSGEATRDYRFEPYDRLQATGRAVDPDNYDLVYTAPMEPGTTLEDIYRTFNIDHPKDFKGHSLSVSDVVVLRHDGKQEAHYCDSFGFQEVPEFLRESPIKTAEMTTEQNYNMIDGVLNNAPSASEVEAREKAGEQLTIDDINADPTPEPPQEEQQQEKERTAADYYYPISEGAARRAKEAMSFSDYRPGSATAEYRQYVDRAFALAQAQKKRVDPMYHEKIDALLDTYARKLAANMNKGYEIAARVPSVMIAGPSNFPVRKKEKQNAASDRNMEEWQYIQGLLEKIRSVGMGGIRQDDPQAIEKLQKKLDGLERLQETMKAVNAYYRKHKTLDGCPNLSEQQIEKLKSSMAQGYHLEDKPFPSFELSNNSAEIRRIKQRIESLTRASEVAYVGWEFDGGRVEANREQGRLQVFFEDKPEADARQQLKNNGFRWSPSAEVWQRLLNDNAYRAADAIPCIRPISGEKPTELQRRSSREQREQKQKQAEKPSIRAQLKAGREEQAKKPPAREKSKELEV